MNTTHQLNIAKAIIDQLTRQHNKLVATLNDLAADSYPSSAGLGARCKNHISDPTANAALKHDEPTQDRQRFRILTTRLHDVANELDNIRAKYLNTPTATPAPTNTPSPCANMHGCPDNNWADKAGRCKPCFEHMRTHNRDRH